MADSEDEYDRKRRDKFRGERGTDNHPRSDRRSDDRGRGREEWTDRNRSRPDYRDYRSPRDRGYSPPGRDGGGPPMKRMRGGDWEDRGPRYGLEGYGMYGYPPDHGYPMHGGAPGFGHPPMHARPGIAQQEAVNPNSETQPPMMTLKQFLATQDDSISDSDAIQKYNEYKLEFKRQQLNEFFVAHKDEEWFKTKYHPEESSKRREEQISYLKHRIDVFTELLDNGDVAKVSIDMNNQEQLLRLLDTVVIKLEGGTEEDLKVLDEKPPPEIPVRPVLVAEKAVEKTDEKVETEAVVKKVDGSDDEEEKPQGDDEKANVAESAKSPSPEAAAPVKQRGKKRSRSADSNSSSSSSSSDDESEDRRKSVPKSPEPVKNDESMKSDDEAPAEAKKENDEDDDEEMKPAKPEGTENGEQKPDDDNSDEKEEKKEKVEGEDEEENKPTETIDLDKEKDDTPRALHKTSSIFLRNLSPTITKAEVEQMCKRYNGFLRVAIADPLLERRWFRRGWCTFQREVNIKEICWNLNNIRLRDCDLGAIVNRDLSRRVRPVNGITAHRTIVRSDIKLVAKVAHNLDEKAGLWKEEAAAVAEGEAKVASNGNQPQSFGLNSRNPVLQNITDYLIEEASAEEEELLGLSSENKEGGEGEMVEREPELIAVLDKLILYLRIVHSVDFYNHCEYPYEDEMPNRCGIIHARGPPPQNKVTITEIQDYIRNFETKMSSFMAKTADLDAVELKKLGAKDTDAEVEKFILANSQELSKEKWLCPLSGKKFKGPDFIRKHIFNKHGEKVDEVRKEVEFYNNYLKDVKRPQLPEHPGNVKKGPDAATPAMHGAGGGYRPGPYGMPYGAPYGFQPPMMQSAPRPRHGYGGRGRGGGSAWDSRPVIHYRDLDAPPRDTDDFL